MNITIFKIITGQILRIMNIPEDFVANNVQAGEDWIEGSYRDNEFYIQDRAPIQISAKPSEHHIFDFDVKQWVDPRTNETEWINVRQQRDKKLLNSDWTQVSDNALTTQKKQEWITYRQALRDITNQPDPFTIEWPIKPTGA